MADTNEILWTAGFLNERFPAPVSPLGWSVVGPLFDEYALREPLRYMGYDGADAIATTRLVHGHPYANVLIFEIFYKPFPEAFMPADAVRYFPEGDTRWRFRAPYPRGMLDPRLIFALLSHFAREPLNWSPLNNYTWERYVGRHDRRVAQLNAQLERAGSPEAILQVAQGAQQASADLLRIHRWSLTYADIFYKWLARLSGDAAQVLISDLDNVTRQVNAELGELGELAARRNLNLDSEAGLEAARADPEFGPALARMLAAHGHRSFSLDIAQPTFADLPELFLRMLQSAHTPGPEKSDWRTKSASARKRLAPWIRPLYDFVLAMARRYALLRENQRYYWHKTLAVSRHAYLRLGDSLCAQGMIASQTDVMYATHPELVDYCAQHLSSESLRAQIETRRAEWKNYQDEYRRAPALAYPAFLKGNRSIEVSSEPERTNWRGRGVSPGQGHGPVRVILDANELGRVRPGEVLVAPATDPGWTPVFARLGGLVLERGGILAHGAIIAREHHLPAVAGIPHITQELADGDWVEVDGSSGTVKRIQK